MPPATSPWSVVITAAAAFFGVVLAQWWTTRREDRSWQRQLQMYTQQWEDQRQRDHQAWLREDQHRFASEKRGHYADFIANFNRAILAMRYTASLTSEEAERRQRENEAPIADLRRWLREAHLERETSDPIERLGDTLSMLRLLAPQDVADAAEKTYDSVWLAEQRFANNQDLTQNAIDTDAAVALAIELRTMMRKDLGIVSRA